MVAGALPLIPRDTSIPPIVATQTQEAGIRHSGKLINLGPEIQRGAPRSNQYQSSSSSLILEIRNRNTRFKKTQLYYTFTSNDRYGLNLAKCVCFLVSKVGQELIRRMGDHYIGLAPPFAPQLPTSYSIYQLFARNAVTDWTIVIISSFLIIASILSTARLFTIMVNPLGVKILWVQSRKNKRLTLLLLSQLPSGSFMVYDCYHTIERAAFCCKAIMGHRRQLLF